MEFTLSKSGGKPNSREDVLRFGSGRGHRGAPSRLQTNCLWQHQLQEDPDATWFIQVVRKMQTRRRVGREEGVLRERLCEERLEDQAQTRTSDVAHESRRLEIFDS
jgi:hypothetical protein